MLGCQDFCGYYDWTFAYVRRTAGEAALDDLWINAIGRDSQRHYLEAGRRAGLRGLYEQWTDTGHAEKCDWTFTLDEQRNVLRWDMRRCPSKGFLINNDLHADEDYCDHCMGWVKEVLEDLNIEVVEHEHNHCGQCWAELSVKGKPREALKLPCDIRSDPTWSHGHIDGWQSGAKRRHGTLTSQLADAITVLGASDEADRNIATSEAGSVIVSGHTYARSGDLARHPAAVLIDAPPQDIEIFARRYLATPVERRPMLLCAYLPAVQPFDFTRFGLPRPAAILPPLIRSGLYRHLPGGPVPTTDVFLVMLAVAAGSSVNVVGVRPGRQNVPHSQDNPARHSIECDLAHLRRCSAVAGPRLRLSPELSATMNRSASLPR